MRRDTFSRGERAAKQVRRVRALYSRIGEPLPADIIIDLHLHLGLALEAVDERSRGEKERSEKCARV